MKTLNDNEIPRYPIHALKIDHRGDAVVYAVVLLASVAVLADQVGWHSRGEVVVVAPATSSAVPRCPESSAEGDVVEHAFLHRGQVFHRECIVINRPGRAARGPAF